MKKKLVITDDHALIRMGIKMALMPQEDKYEIIGETDSAEALLDLLRTGVEPDLILLDVIMPGMSGIEATTILKIEYPQIPVLILSSEMSENTITELVKLGVEGYISKNYTEDELSLAIDSILDGINFFGKDISAIIDETRKLNQSIPDEHFSQRELEIIGLCSKGKTAKEIAEILCLSPRTISNHKQNIFSKMGINNNYEMVNYAFKHGFLQAV